MLWCAQFSGVYVCCINRVLPDCVETCIEKISYLYGLYEKVVIVVMFVYADILTILSWNQ